LKVSAACKNCYAETRSNRFGEDFSGQRIVLSDAGWKDPVKWNREAGEAMQAWDLHCELCKQSDISDPVAEWHRRAGGEPIPQRRRVFCASLADVFEDWNGPMVNHKGEKLFVHRDGSWSSQQRSAPASPPRSSLTMNDVRRRLFALIDATPNLDWLLLTKRPENVRRRL